MQSKFKLDHQTAAVAMATGAGAVVAIIAMFVPTVLWETLTGSTGVSEMVPATAAPLGDTARALISFAFGALTLAILSAMLLRKAAMSQDSAVDGFAWEPVELQEDDETETERTPLFTRLHERISAFVEARRSGQDISRLDDLPKLRAGDAHPDAPPRRPFSANRDLIEAEESPVEIAEIAEIPVEAESLAIETVEIEQIEEAVEAPAQSLVQEIVAEVAEAEPAEIAEPRMAEIGSLDEMVRRFESALAEREAQLAHIESIARELPTSNVQPIRPDIAAPLAAEAAPATIEPEPAPLRPVASAEAPAETQPAEAEELDAALRSALETLHRMNARTH